MSFFMFLVWIGVSCAVGSAASNRFHRSGFGWFLVSCLISPLIAGPLLLVVGPLEPRRSSGSWEHIDWSGQPQTVPAQLVIQKPWTKADVVFTSVVFSAAAALVGFLMIVSLYG